MRYENNSLYGILLGLFAMAVASSASAEMVLVPADPTLPPSSKPTDSMAKNAEGLHKQLAAIGEMLHEYRENIKLQKAVIQARAKIPFGEQKTFEVITKGGPLFKGGEFVALREANVKSFDEPGAMPTGQPFTLGGFSPRLKDEKRDKAELEEMKARAEALKREQALNEAIEAEKRFAEAKAAAAAAAAELTAKQEAARKAAEASTLAANQAAAADKAARAAERSAQRDGARIQNQIRSELNRFRNEGGPYRAPSGNGSH